MTSRDPAFPVIIPRSSTAAYRADLVGRDDTFGPHDSAWVAVASLLEHAALLAEPDRSRLLVDAIEFSREIVGEENIGRLGEREWQDRDRTPIEAVMLLADNVHRSGAFNLAGVILDALLVADVSLNAVQRGRIISQRARLFRKMGLMDEAAAHDRCVGRLGRQARSVELRIRESLGFATLAQLHGNYPEMHRYSQRAVRLAARAGMPKMERDARNALMIALGASRRFDEGLINGWKVYQASVGHSMDEAEALQNIAQLLLDAGHFAEARAGFAAAVSHQLPVHMMLAALGGLALASASAGQPETVEWAAAEIDRLTGSTVSRYSIALALLESAIALHRVGKSEGAEHHRVAAASIGREHHFHEIVFRAEALEPAAPIESDVSPLALTGEAATVANEVAWLEPKRLPEHVELAITT